MDTKPYFAIFWSRWNTWTLNPTEILECKDNKCFLGFEEALRSNHMSLLGDFMLATLPPLRFRILTDSSKPRIVKDNGTAIFSIGGIKILSDDQIIQDPLEQRIAFFLMLYGDWPSELGEANVEEGELIHFDFLSKPVEPAPN
jgi:hypothetical protein